MTDTQSSPSPLRGFIFETALSTIVPLVIYRFTFSHGASEFRALVLSSLFPLGQSIFDLVRLRRLNPVSITVLLGIAVTLGALLLGGSPRLLLIRESLLTAVIGLACLVSLALPKPLMFYFGRHYMAGKDAERAATFTRNASIPAVRRTHRTITLVWGSALLTEFTVRTWMVYHLPTTTVLAVAPILFNATALLTFVWTMRYARQAMKRGQALTPETPIDSASAP